MLKLFRLAVSVLEKIILKVIPTISFLCVVIVIAVVWTSNSYRIRTISVIAVVTALGVNRP